MVTDARMDSETVQIGSSSLLGAVPGQPNMIWGNREFHVGLWTKKWFHSAWEEEAEPKPASLDRIEEKRNKKQEEIAADADTMERMESGGLSGKRLVHRQKRLYAGGNVTAEKLLQMAPGGKIPAEEKRDCMGESSGGQTEGEAAGYLLQETG